MDPNVEDANKKLEEANEIEATAADVEGDASTELETTAANLRSEAEQEKADAEYYANQEKQEVDEKYGTT